MKNICLQMTRKACLVFTMTLLMAFPAFAQKITVSGNVTDPSGEPLIGASVMSTGSAVGTATDIDGNYTITVEPNGSLTFSYVGFNSQTIAVDGRSTINVTLSENSVVLDEVVAIGYGTVKKSDATGSVATVKPSEIEAGLATSAQDLLVGASPGVVVTTDGGNPSGGAKIQIRGGASLSASNEPLIVIDGVPMDTKGLIGSSNPLALVSPENVESMTILKDASATAIYGSRASNGVIIITTKQGLSGRPQVNFTANMYINTPRNYVNMMDAGEYRSFILNQYGEESTQAGALGLADTNWQKEALRTTVSSDYSLSVGGTVAFLPYRVSVSYTNNNGILKQTKMDRVTMGINLTPKFFDGLLSVNANVKGAYIKNGYTNNTLGSCVSMNPTLPVKAPDGNVFNNWTTYDGSSLPAGPETAGSDMNTTTAPINPISRIMDYESNGKAYQSIGNLQVDLKMPFLTDLRANLNLGYDMSHGECLSGNGLYSPQAWADGYNYRADDGTVKTIKDGGTTRKMEHQSKYNLLLDFYLNYNTRLESINSSLDVTAGYSWQRFKSWGRDYTYVNAVGDPANGQYLGEQANPTYRYSNLHQLVSFFGRVNYIYADKYLLTVTVRRDGTSRFSKDHRWGTFPSVALGWKLLDEDFMEPVRDIMSELKLRAGYGVTGQQDLGDDYFPYMAIYSMSTDDQHRYPDPTGSGSNITLIKPNAYNPDIKWEETHTWNVGVDYGFLNNRITGSLDFYKRKTTDLLTYANFAAGSNLSNRGNMNIGDLENTGIEFNISTRPIVSRDLTWTSDLNLSWNHNKITKLAESADGTVGDISVGKGNKVQKHVVGHTAYSFYVYEQVYDAAGNPMEGVFVDRDHDGVITEKDRYLYHSRDPKVTLTWTNTVRWRNWDFGIVLRANMGNYIYNNTQAANVFKSSNAALPLNNMMADTFLFESGSNEKYLSDYFVQNGSFLRCDNITAGYTWDNLLNDNLRLRLYGAVQNPFVITKYKGLDPEVFSGIDNGVYPRPVTFTLGVVATF